MDGLLKRISFLASVLLAGGAAKGRKGMFSRSTRPHYFACLRNPFWQPSAATTKMHSLDSIIIALKGGRKSVTYGGRKGRSKRLDQSKACGSQSVV